MVITGGCSGSLCKALCCPSYDFYNWTCALKNNPFVNGLWIILISPFSHRKLRLHFPGSSKTGFLNLVIIVILVQILHCGGIPGLYPLDASLSCDNQQSLQTLPNVPWQGGKIAWVEDHCSKRNATQSHKEV